MLKKIVVVKAEIDEEFAGEIARLCGKYEARIGIETGKRTVRGTDSAGLVRSGVQAGERIRLMIEGAEEQQAYEALRALIGKGAF
ncbi:MAG: HPr family phosphocarrier protein [Christensenellales bacterium]|jgi:phosphotransferase system HPr-like phosphotransfer protein